MDNQSASPSSAESESQSIHNANTDMSHKLNSLSLAEPIGESNTFTCFGRLPLELRQKIWQEASNAARVVVLYLERCRCRSHFHMTEATNNNLSVPSTIQACKEARENSSNKHQHVFRAFFERLLTGIQCQPPRIIGGDIVTTCQSRVLFSELDTLYLRSRPFLRAHTPAKAPDEVVREYCKFLAADLDFRKIRSIAVDVGTAIRIYYEFFQCLVWVASLEELIIIVRKVSDQLTYDVRDLRLVNLGIPFPDVAIAANEFANYRMFSLRHFCFDQPTMQTVERVLGRRMPITAREQFKMPMFKLMGLATGLP